jgi:hypothetical protein
VAGLGARLAAIDEQHATAALLQVQRYADADDASAEHDHIGLSCRSRHRRWDPFPLARSWA